jgi:hypothetical protein
MEMPPMVTLSSDRLVGLGLALYLLPALLVVLVVSALGVLVLNAGRLVAPIVHSQACHPRESVGSEVFRS